MYVSGSVVSVNVTTLNLIDNVISSGSLIISGNTSLGSVVISGIVSAGTHVGSLFSSGSFGAAGATIGTLYAVVVTSSNLQVSGIVSAGTHVGSLFSSGSIGAAGATIGTLYANNSTNASVILNNSSIIFRDNSDLNHGLTYNAIVDGPELWGWGGGALGYGGFTGANSLVWSSSGINVNGTVSAGNMGVLGATIGTLYSTTVTSGAIRTNNLTVSNLIRSPNAIFTSISVGNISTSNLQTSSISTSSINIPYGYNTINVSGYTNTALIDVSWDGSNDVTSIYTPGNWSSGPKLCIKGDGSVTASSIGVDGATIGTLYSTTITSGSVLTSNISVNNLTVSNLLRSPNAIFSTSISVGNISSSNIQISGSLTTGSILASNINVSNLTASNLAINNLSVSNLTASNLIINSLNSGKLSSNTLGNIITTNGNIGINTITPIPSTRLHIYDPLITGTNFSTSSLLIDRFNTNGNYSGCHIMLRGGYYSANGTTDTNISMGSGASGNNRNDFIACLGGTNVSPTTGSWDSSNYTGIVFVVQGGGNSYNLNGVWGSISDARVKENIIDSRDYLEDLNKLRVVKYSLKADKLSSPNQLGLLAQEVEQVFPGLINTGLNNYVTDENGNSFQTKAIKHSVINMMMLKSIQELYSKIKGLEDKIAIMSSK